MPVHVFSLSESKIIALKEDSEQELFHHNLNYMMRAYPKGTRVRSSNLDPAPFWRLGIQIVALNWQQCNAAMMLNEAMFADTGGWILKPPGYREDESRLVPQPQRIAFNCGVQLLALQPTKTGVQLPDRHYIKCELHVESESERRYGTIAKEGKNKGGEWKRTSTTRKTADLERELMVFRGVEGAVPELSFIR